MWEAGLWLLASPDLIAGLIPIGHGDDFARGVPLKDFVGEQISRFKEDVACFGFPFGLRGAG